MKYKILPDCKANIKTFYKHVAMKYLNTYSFEDMNRNIDEANSGKWYFAYKVFGDTVVVFDARHAQNIH